LGKLRPWRIDDDLVAHGPHGVQVVADEEIGDAKRTAQGPP
jgi:hypothetical protein